MLRLVTAALLCGVPVSALAQEGQAVTAPVVAAGGAEAGSVTLADTPTGVLIGLTLKDGAVPAGEHAIHLHEKGDCSDTAKFESAGAHYNPKSHEHGYLSAQGPHAGDLPNFTVVAGQQTSVELFNSMVRLSAGDARLLDADGSAVVVHAAVDDHRSQPAGASGDRIACAEIKAQ